uniref:BZIP domain-containing protein n=1 Tax=Globisporangium ultimum (strain ATCC 200006 / CBS 805.95 / DAOM BR144) TaxID=431595 RepID=K3W8S4_GLOUD
MSFLLAEGENVATLEEAFAFIESCSDDSSSGGCASASDSFDALSDHSSVWSVADVTSSLSRSDDSDSSSPLTRDFSRSLGIAIAPRPRIDVQGKKPAPQTRLRISREANTRAVHQYRMRTKNQILELREEALQLSARVEQLKKRQEYVKKTMIDRHMNTYHAMREQGEPSTALQNSLELAVAEYQKRQESETLNRKLKHALEKQSKMNKILETFFQRHVAKHVEKKQLLVVSSNDAPIFKELLSYVGGVMQSMVPSATASINTNDTSLMKQDPMLGQVFEVTTNTPLPCTRHQLETALLAHILGFDERNSTSKEGM